MNNNLIILILIVLVVLGIFLFNSCKLKCSFNVKEGLSHRVPTTQKLLHNAYSKYPLDAYHVKWPISIKENYSDVYDCRKMCENIMENTLRGKCFQNCLDWRSLMYHDKSKSCLSAEDCRPGDLCVDSAPYTGGKYGMCMSQTEPGVPRDSHKENYQRRSCSPGYFYNDIMNQCQPMWQGDQSAYYIRNEKPAPAPEVSIPGSTLRGYGTGSTDPYDVRLPGFVLESS